MPQPPDRIDIVSLPAPPIGWTDHAYVPLAGGAIGLVRLDRELAAANSREAPLAWDKTRIRLSVYDGRDESEALTILPALRYPIIDRFADGRWLIVGARAGLDEPNARLFGATGVPLAHFAVGDGVSNLVCMAGGTAWFGYFDEGVCNMSRPDLPSQSGLAAFDEQGRCARRFRADGYSIIDCYALGSTDATVWACTYTDFPIVRVEAGGVRLWANDVKGASAIAAKGDHVILAGGYEGERDRVVLLRLEEHRAKRLQHFRLSSICSNAKPVGGRDGMLHAVGDGRWIKLDIEDWLANLR